MGFFSDFKRGYEQAEKKMERETEIAHMSPGKARLLLLQKEKAKKSGRPSTTNKGGVIESSVRNLYATSDLDEVYANCAPKMTNALFDIKEKVDSYAEYKKLQGEHEELQRSYETLQKQYDELNATLKILANQVTQQK